MCKVSLGLPVHNGERYLKETLDCLLGQSYRDFEIIISNNASTDRTAEICEEYRAKDSRIRVLEHPHLLPPPDNFNATFHASRGEYFKWVAADDLHDEDYLSRCVEVLERSPQHVGVYTDYAHIDSEGNIRSQQSVPIHYDHSHAPRRFHHFMLEKAHLCVEIFGLFRRSVMADTLLLTRTGGGDRILLTELTLRGPFARIPEVLFYSRSHETRATDTVRDVYGWAFWFDPVRRGRLIFPHTETLAGRVRAVMRTPMPWPEKGLCFLCFLRPRLLMRYGKRAWQDVRGGIRGDWQRRGS